MKTDIVYKLTNIKAVPCSSSNEKWLLDGKVVPIDRKPIDWQRCMQPMYTTRTINGEQK